jgi:hypothetical protein
MDESAYRYDNTFHAMAAVASAHAARRIVTIVRTILPIGSVVDVGCARGTWLREWQAQGVDDIVGVDGDYVYRNELEIAPHCFVVADLDQRLSLSRRFDLAQSLEVAEHLPPARAATFVADLVALAPAVLFSAAAPGQGGENHLNEQPANYWQSLFDACGYVPIDCIRPLLAADTGVPAWYRYNLVLYVRRACIDSINPFATQFRINDGEQIPDVSPPSYRLRKFIVRLLPKSVCDRLARWNAQRISTGFAPLGKR